MKIKITGFFFRWMTYILFFLMFVFPMVIELLYVKVFLFGLLFVFYTIAIIKRGYLPLHKSVAKWTFIMFIVGIIFCIEGLIERTPGAFNQGKVYIFWPLIYIFLLTSIKDSKILVGIQRTIVISTIFLSLYGITHILANLSILPDFFALSLFKSEIIGFGYLDGFMAMTMEGINSLAFLVPYCMTALIFWLPGTETNPINRKLLWAALILGLIFGIVTARKSVWLVIILAPVIIFSFNQLSNKNSDTKRRKNKKKLIPSIFVLCFLIVTIYISLTSIYEFNLVKVFNELLSGFNIVSNDNERYEQFNALIRGWWEHPIFGSGLGATAVKYGSIRSIDSPWAYELYYLAILFQVGLVGTIIYASGVIWTYIQGFRMMKSSTIHKNTILPFMVGMTCMFIAGGTNPVFIRFDGIWFYFLPLAFINNWMLNRKK